MNLLPLILATFVKLQPINAAFDFWNGYPFINEFWHDDTITVYPLARFSVDGQELPFRLPLTMFSQWGFQLDGTRLDLRLSTAQPADTLPIAQLFSIRGTDRLSRLGLLFYRPTIAGPYFISYDHVEMPSYGAISSRTGISADMGWKKVRVGLSYIGMTYSDPLLSKKFSFLSGSFGLGNASFRLLSAVHGGNRFEKVEVSYAFRGWEASAGGMEGTPFFTLERKFGPVSARLGYVRHAPLLSVSAHTSSFMASMRYSTEGFEVNGIEKEATVLRFSSIFLRGNNMVELDGIVTDTLKAISWASASELPVPITSGIFLGGGFGGTVTKSDSVTRDFRVQAWLRLSKRLHKSLEFNGIAIARYQPEKAFFVGDVVLGLRLFEDITVSYILDNYLRYKVVITANFRG